MQIKNEGIVYSEIKYPIGIQTFPEIIQNKYLYVDKTAIMYSLVNNYKYVFLSRPRRFGKSLFLSTLESYFKGDKHLFKGLEVEGLEKEWKKYPVIRLDLSAENYDNPTKVKEKIDQYLQCLEDKYDCDSTKSLPVRFGSLIRNIAEKENERVVILIDEYDKPMLDTIEKDNLHEDIKSELRSFYSVLESCDEYIRFAMLTGVTKFGKVSVFSGLNNLKDISMLPRYNSICGISESEFHRDFVRSVSDFAISHNISEKEIWNKFKECYDGYHFARTGEDIYNPYSVLNAFDDEQLNYYWFASGTSDYLIKLIRTHSFRVQNLEGERRNEMSLSNITNLSRDLVPLLYQAGYLTIKSYDESENEYVLGFPNKEVSEGFWGSLADEFFHISDAASVFDTRKFVNDIRHGNAEKFMIRLQSLLSDTNSGPELNKEIHFQNMLAVIGKMLGFRVKTEVSSSAGRCDMQIFTPDYIYIFEFKLDSTPEKAIEQIHDRHYADAFNAEERTKILIGANFSTTSRSLDGWIIEIGK